MGHATTARQLLESEIERLINLLDDMSDDADLEDGGDDEPTLGAPEQSTPHGGWARGSTDDREDVCEDEGAECADDREGDELQHGGEEHDGGEPDGDSEPSLGWTIDGAFANSDDVEGDAGVPAEVLASAWRRYNGEAPSPRLLGLGQTVDVERQPWRRRLSGLSDQQRAAVAPRLNRREVGL